jgi:hypothetical protein
MNLLSILNTEQFNIFFSVIVGIGVVCLIRPICKGTNCEITKPPSEKDFDKYVYRLSGGKCYEFQTNLVACPASGTIEAFRECSLSLKKEKRDSFARRRTPIPECE